MSGSFTRAINAQLNNTTDYGSFISSTVSAITADLSTLTAETDVISFTNVTELQTQLTRIKTLYGIDIENSGSLCKYVRLLIYASGMKLCEDIFARIASAPHIISASSAAAGTPMDITEPELTTARNRLVQRISQKLNDDVNLDPSDFYNNFFANLVNLKVLKNTERYVSWRDIFEHTGAIAQCKSSEALFGNHANFCYICGLPYTDTDNQCEHVIPAFHALGYNMIIQQTPTKIGSVTSECKEMAEFEYAPSHICCNQTKNDDLWIIVNSANGTIDIDEPSIESTLSNIHDNFTSANPTDSSWKCTLPEKRALSSKPKSVFVSERKAFIKTNYLDNIKRNIDTMAGDYGTLMLLSIRLRQLNALRFTMNTYVDAMISGAPAPPSRNSKKIKHSIKMFTQKLYKSGFVQILANVRTLVKNSIIRFFNVETLGPAVYAAKPDFPRTDKKNFIDKLVDNLYILNSSERNPFFKILVLRMVNYISYFLTQYNTVEGPDIRQIEANKLDEIFKERFILYVFQLLIEPTRYYTTFTLTPEDDIIRIGLRAYIKPEFASSDTTHESGAVYETYISLIDETVKYLKKTIIPLSDDHERLYTGILKNIDIASEASTSVLTGGRNLKKQKYNTKKFDKKKSNKNRKTMTNINKNNLHTISKKYRKTMSSINKNNFHKISKKYRKTIGGNLSDSNIKDSPVMSCMEILTTVGIEQIRTSIGVLNDSIRDMIEYSQLPIPSDLIPIDLRKVSTILNIHTPYITQNGTEHILNPTLSYVKFPELSVPLQTLKYNRRGEQLDIIRFVVHNSDQLMNMVEKTARSFHLQDVLMDGDLRKLKYYLQRGIGTLISGATYERLFTDLSRFFMVCFCYQTRELYICVMLRKDLGEGEQEYDALCNPCNLTPFCYLKNHPYFTL